VVIDQIDIDRIPVIEPEYHPPVARHPHRPLAFPFALQGVQPVIRLVQVVRACGRIQCCKQAAQLGGMLGINPPRVAGFEKPLQPLMAKSRINVTCNLSPIRH
jgi:hypothetical protein